MTPANQLSPEEVATRGFASAFRGVSETEVRSFLRRVADELAYFRDRERELEDRVAGLEGELRNPPAPTEQQLLDSLGEETARVLRSAQGAAEEIRAKAQSRADLLVEQSEGEAQRLTQEAEELHAARVTAGEERAAETVRAAEHHASELRSTAEALVAAERDRATSQAEAEIEAARAEGREMVAEARAVRERILADLARRRASLVHQIDELRQGRERLLGAYRVVKDTLTEATEALAKVEVPAGPPLPVPAEVPEPGEGEQLPARADATRPAPEPVVEPAAEPVAAAVDLTALPEAEPVPAEPAPGEPALEPAVVVAEPALAEGPDLSDAGLSEAGEPEAGESAAPSTRDVNALFAKIRAARAEAAEAAAEALAGEPTPVSGFEVAEVEAEEPGGAGSPVAEAVDAEAEPEPSPDAGLGGEPPPDATAAAITRRDTAVSPIERDLLKLAKRMLQDEQNELLDAIRKVRGRPTAGKVLPSLDAHVDSWAGRMALAIDAAHSAGSGGAVDPPLELARELAAQFVEPLRERIAATIDSTVTAADEEDEPELDEGELAQRIGARYREWKSQELQDAIGDLVSAAYSRGVVDAAPEGAVLEWVTVAGGCCPDCDDNTLEPTTSGKPFPTGQRMPPAHPGCRCMVTVVGAPASTASV
ncbi:MAG: DivIVA domain-containing protein [Acidimicrobiia bacterium]